MTITTERPAAPVTRASSGVAIDGSRLFWWRMVYRGLSRQGLCDALAAMYRDGHPDALPFTHRKALIRQSGARTWTVRAWDPVISAEAEKSFRSKPAARQFKIAADAALPRHPVVLSAPDPGSEPDAEAGHALSCTVCGAPAAGGLTRDSIAKFEKYPGPGSRKPKPATALALAAALSTPDRTITIRDLTGETEPGVHDGATFELPPEIAGAQAREQENAAMRAWADSIGRPDLYTNPSGRIFYYRELRDKWAAAKQAQSLAS